MFLYRLFRWYSQPVGWTYDDSVPVEKYKRSVGIALPHTSNWDFVYALGAFDHYGLTVRFTIKDQLMKFPLKYFFRYAGGLAINRRPKKEGEERESMVDAMVRLFDEHDDLLMMITPEGSRSKRTKWKSGFYHVAKGANVPIALGYMDYEKKVAGVGKLLYPSDDIEKDMREIMEFYKDIPARHPDRFSLDERYI